jgi:hypothetical protein
VVPVFYPSGRRRWRPLPILMLIALLAPLALGWHWAKFNGWRDRHINYASGRLPARMASLLRIC